MRLAKSQCVVAAHGFRYLHDGAVCGAGANGARVAGAAEQRGADSHWHLEQGGRQSESHWSYDLSRVLTREFKNMSILHTSRSTM